MTEQTNKKRRTRPTSAKLYHRDQLIGLITDIAVMDMFQWAGYVQLTAAAEQVSEMFDYFSQDREPPPEQSDAIELPFDKSLLRDWFIEDENGRREILWPVIRNGNEIYWRD